MSKGRAQYHQQAEDGQAQGRQGGNANGPDLVYQDAGNAGEGVVQGDSQAFLAGNDDGGEIV